MGPTGGSLARIRPVRANPTIGGSLRSAATSGSTVNPMARRSAATSSRPLQIVGVSQRFSISRSAVLKGSSVIYLVPAGNGVGQKTDSARLDALLSFEVFDPVSAVHRL